jgi:hypothetical protein
MSEFFEKNKKGLSKNFSQHFGYRVFTLGSWHKQGFVQLFMQKVVNGKRYTARNVEIVWEEYDHGKEQVPFLAFDCMEDNDQYGTDLLDALQDLFTPAEKKQRPFIEGELEATKKHLEDMRSMAFKAPAFKGDRFDES